MPDLIMDSQAAIGFVLSQTAHIEREVNEAQYPDIQYPFLIPVDTSAHPFAKTVTYFSGDRFGRMDWIDGNSGDIPMVGSERQKHETDVHMAGLGYSYGFEDIEHARMLGRSLPSEDAMVARRGSEEHMDDLALRGSARKGFEGLINNSTVTAGAAIAGDWDAATDAQVIKDVNDALYAVYADSNRTSDADTLLMSPDRMNLLATRRLGDTGMTLLSFLRINNTYTARTGQALTMRAVAGLETAGVGDTQRLVAYRRNPQVLKLHMPMPHRFLRPREDKSLVVSVPGVIRTGGLDIRRPKEVRYTDGV